MTKSDFEKPDMLQAIEPVAKALGRLGVPYYIGGSVASSAYGMARSTLDADFIAELKPEHVAGFVEVGMTTIVGIRNRCQESLWPGLRTECDP